MKRNKTGILGAEKPDEEVLEILKADKEVFAAFNGLTQEMQKEVTAFLGGRSGVDLLYDNFFRKIFNPEEHEKRVEALLSVLLGQKVRIKEILSREGSQIVDSGSFVVMDIIVLLEDGSYVDVEMQKIGYLFPSQRSACYISDMIMRQYNRRKNEKKDGFRYKDMKPVYLFVLIEKPPAVFKESESFIHKRLVSYSSGIELPELEQVTYIDLDSFAKKSDNKDDDLSLWLTLLTKTDAATVVRLAELRPEFAEIYHEIAEFRKDPKELVKMFSEALAIMDSNSEKYMIDDLQEMLQNAEQRADDEKQRADDEKQRADKAEDELDTTKEELDTTKEELDKALDQIHKLEAQLAANTQS